MKAKNRRYLLIVITLLTINFPMFVMAQSHSRQENAKAIVENIESESEGQILIDVPDDLLDQLLANPEVKKSQSGNGYRSHQGVGYRIQVFSDGRNQHSLESRAKARGAAITSKFPKYRGQVYSFSSSPNWYTRVGNFRSQAEANQALAELKRAFPQFASEMRVVKSKINL